MPTGIGSGIAGEVFTDEIGSGSRGGSTICPTRYSVNLNGLSQIGQETGTLLDLGTNNFSYSFWFKTSETSVQGIFSTDFNNTGVGLDIFLSASGILTATFDSVTFPTTASLNDGEWYHAVLSVDRSGDWKWYIDGINTNTLANPVGTAIFVGNYLWGNSFSTSFFNGNLTELSIWGTALSLSEVLTIYNNMFGSQTCLTDLTFGSGNLIQNGSFNEIGPQLIDNPTFNAPTSPNLVDNPNFTDTGADVIYNGDFADTSIALGTTGSGWTLSAGLSEYTTFGGDTAVKMTRVTTTNQLRAKTVGGSNVVSANTSYKLTYTVLENNGVTGFRIFASTSTNIPYDVSATPHVVYFTTTDANVLLQFVNDTNNSDITFTDIVVEELGADWILGTGWSIGEDKAIYDGSDYASINQLISNISGKSLKVSFEIKDWQSGTIRIPPANRLDGLDERYSGDGINVIYFTSTVNDLKFQPQQFDGSITNISVQEVDWAFGGGWSLGSNKALATAAAGGDTLYQAGVFTLDKSYKTTFLSTLDSGNCFAEFGSDGFIGRLPSGTASNLFYYQTNEVGDSARIAFEVQSLMTGSISNVLTYQMDPNGYWNIPTANSTQLVLNPMFTNTGPEEVTNGDFSGTALGPEKVVDGDFPLPNANWVAQGGAEITTDGARINNTVTGVNAYIAQLLLGTLSGKSFVLTYDVITTNGETLAIEQATSIPLDTSTTGTNRKLYFTWNRVNNNLVIKRLTSGTDVTIDNVSVKEVLQLVTNGDFTEGTEGVAGGNFESGLIGTVGNAGGTVYTWALNTVAPISGTQDGLLSITSVGTNVSHPRLQFDGTLALDESFVLTFDYKVNSGTCKFSSIRTGGVSSVSFPTVTLTGSGTYTFYFQGEGTGLLTINFDGTNLFDTQFDNISIKELGADWTVVDGAGTVTFGDSFAEITKTSVNPSVYLSQDYAVTHGASHKLTYTITENTFTGSGAELGLSGAGAYGSVVLDATASATPKTVYLTVTDDTPSIAALRFYSQGDGGSIKITNISVQELGQDWTVGTGWSFGDDIASCDGTASSSLYQNVLGVESKTYKITGTVSNYTSGTLQVGGSSNALEVSGDGAFIHYRVWTSDPNLYLKSKPGDGFNGSITNISVKETGLDWISPDAGVVNTFSATGLTMTSVNGTGDNTIQQVGVTADDQAYKVEYTIVGSSLTAGNYLQFYNGATYVNMKTSVGTHILHFTRSGADDSVFLKLASNDSSLTDTVDIGSITIVEVQGWTLEDGKLVGDLPDLAKSATQDIGAIAGNSYKATMDVALAEEELITNGSFREVGADLVLEGDFPKPSFHWLKAASTTINGGSATFGGLGTVADMLAGAFALRVEADGGVVEAQSCLISDLTFLTENP